MGTGNKSIKTFKAKKDDGAMTQSANSTKLGTLQRKNGKLKEWVLKKLSSKQEVLIECMTGEIYRYIIGNRQPKIRTGDENNLLSEFVPYRAVRDILEVPKHKVNVKRFREAFINNPEGFMLVLWSSILLEENDLSSQNYGLALANQPTETEERYDRFIKIDHGQSFNSLRISKDSRIKKLAPIKYFPPPTDADLDQDGVDTRTKKKRKQIWWRTKRTYKLQPAYMDSIIMQFLLGLFDNAFIRSLKYQPAALSLYDGRLLSFFKHLGQDRYDRLEMAKHRAIAKIVFTTDDLMEKIAQRAAHKTLPVKTRYILKKLKENKNSFFETACTDLDFCVLVAKERKTLETNISNSFQRMIWSRVKEDFPHQVKSERYGDLFDEEPVYTAALNSIDEVGKIFGTEEMIMATEALLLAIRNKLVDYEWKVRGGGGRKVKIKPGDIRVMPENASLMCLSLTYWRLSHKARQFRTLQDILFLAGKTARKRGVLRSSQTSSGYKEIQWMIDDFSKRFPPIKYLRDKYAQRNAERYLDFFKLSREIRRKAICKS